MLSLGIALLTTIVVAWLIVKRMKPQAVLFAGGFFLLAVAILMGVPLLDAKKSTGLVWFDIFKFVEDTFSTRAAGIGLMIMTVGGFAKYMDYIGASRSLVHLASKPLSLIRSPYLLLAVSYIIGQLLNIVIPSAAGLCYCLWLRCILFLSAWASAACQQLQWLLLHHVWISALLRVRRFLPQRQRIWMSLIILSESRSRLLS